MRRTKWLPWVCGWALWCCAGAASATLNPVGIYKGRVGISVDGVGSNESPTVGEVTAEIPLDATVLKAYLYSAGTPSPWYAGSPTTLADYNGAGITLAGQAVTQFDTLIGASSTRDAIGRWYTARADVTSLVDSLISGSASPTHHWAGGEGTRKAFIDGAGLARVYASPSRPQGSVVLLDGGQQTGGETTTVNFGSPLTDPGAASFAAQMGLGISFSVKDQASEITVNGLPLTDMAGNYDDGSAATDGSLITVGGLGDDPGNNVATYADDDELYDLKGYLHTGDTAMTLYTVNPTNDDNIFFGYLAMTADISSVTPSVPEPGTYALMLAGLAALGLAARRRGVQQRP